MQKYQFSLDQISFLLIFYCAIALISAYISQYVFGYQPCILCIHQRQLFFASILFALIGAVFIKQEKLKKIFLFSAIFFVFCNFLTASYHVGVEKKIFAGPSTCSSYDLDKAKSIDELREVLLKTPSVRCDQPNFFFLGLSMAFWNAIYCLILTSLTIVVYFRFRQNN